MKTYLIFAAAAALLGFFGFQGFLIKNLRDDIASLEGKVQELTFEIKLKDEELRDLTQQKEILDNQVLEATKQREAIRQNLTRRLREAQSKPAPIECEAAIEFAIENKDDLKWPN